MCRGSIEQLFWIGVSTKNQRLFKKTVQQGRSERGDEEVHTKLRLTRSLRSHASG